jgi:hypothetical protein
MLEAERCLTLAYMSANPLKLDQIRCDFLAIPLAVFACLRLIICGRMLHGSVSSSVIGDVASGNLPNRAYSFSTLTAPLSDMR